MVFGIGGMALAGYVFVTGTGGRGHLIEITSLLIIGASFFFAGINYIYEASKEFGRLIATLVHHELPKFTSIERPTAKRKGRIYIDFLQNRPQATLATAYSVRPKPGATVSMPLHWEEVKKGMRIQDFNIHNTIDRLRVVGDIFKPVLGRGINMQQALKELGKLK